MKLRYRLRTLLVLMAILPPLLAVSWWKYSQWKAEQERLKAQRQQAQRFQFTVQFQWTIETRGELAVGLPPSIDTLPPDRPPPSTTEAVR